MQIRVRLFATLRENRGKEVYPEFDHAPTLKEVLDSLQITPDQVAIVLVNGHDADLSRTVRESDTVSLFPPVGGG